MFWPTCSKSSDIILKLVSDCLSSVVDDIGLAVPGTTHHFIFTIALQIISNLFLAASGRQDLTISQTSLANTFFPTLFVETLLLH